MLFKMILDGARDEERPIARGFLKYLVAGFACGLALGCVLVGGIFLMLAGLRIEVPFLFVAAMLLQFGPIGGLIGAGLYLSRITDRTVDDAPRTAEDSGEDDDDRPGGGTKAPITPAFSAAPKRPPRSSPLPAPA